MKETPLTDWHRAHGANLVEFAGFAMPQQYSSIRAEHEAVRTHAGLFDLSHMGEAVFAGDSAKETLQNLVTNDLSRLEDGTALYTVMCNEQGGIIDDLIVYRESDTSFFVVINAACIEKDLAWMRGHLLEGTELTDRSDATALIAVQGPDAVALLDPGVDSALAGLESFHFTDTRAFGYDVRVARTGYTGEDGVEFYLAMKDASPFLAALEASLPASVLPCGLGARDTLRLEAGLRLYGTDMDETTTPYDAGLGWTVKLAKDAFIGKDALMRRKDAGGSAFVGLTLSGRALPRHGCAVDVNGSPAGVVTSGNYGFTVGQPVAMARLDRPPDPSDHIGISIRDTVEPAELVPLPFYRRQR